MKRRGLTFYQKKKKVNVSVVKEVFSWMFGILVSVFIAGVAVYFLGMTVDVVGVSMEPSLSNGQTILVNRFIYILTAPKVGDVVVFLPNGNENSHYYVKRVVACPGDKLFIEDGTLFVNGLASSFVDEKILDAGIAENEMILPGGEFFCIGDNPNHSEDSRSANIGTVKEKDIVGAGWFRLKYKKNSMGFIK